jgi:16S rRNA (guanine527-N7)-methyltransferase
VDKFVGHQHRSGATVAVLLLRATEYGNRGSIGADARAGHPHRPSHGKTERPLEGAFSLSVTHGIPGAEPARSARLILERLLDTDAPAIAATLPPGFADAAERYVALLLDANSRLNLTRVTEPDAVARLHLLDSLSALPLMDELRPSRAVDIGSGGGVPGLVLALARPDIDWVLVDSVRKKCDAVREIAGALGLASVRVVAERAEALGRSADHRERYDLATVRACASMPVLVEYALPLIRVGGALLAWKGPLADSDEEIVRGRDAGSLLGGGTPEIHATRIGALGDHRLVVTPKERRTAARYPRRPGEPARAPLA